MGEIELILENCFLVKNFSIDLVGQYQYRIEITILNFRSNEDSSELLKLTRLVRSKMSRLYQVEFDVAFTL